MSSNFVIYLFVIAVTYFELVRTDGVFYVLFDHYDNPTGHAANGHCCDGKWGICQTSGCDYLFTICLDDGTHADSTDECEFGKKISKRVKNVASVDFGDHISDLDNPLIFPFVGTFPQYIVLKIDIYDKDTPYTDNDFVDFLRVTVPLNIRTQSQNVVSQEFLAYGSRKEDKTSLSGEVMVRCATNWYSEDCGRYCAPPGYAGHYTCDPGTGHKICQPGWTGPDCNYLATSPRPTTRPTTTPRLTTTPRPTTITSYEVVFIDRDNADCDNLARSGYRYQDGIYELQVGNFPPFEAYCDMSAEGWTVIQRRNTGDLDFNRDWDTYKRGFGDIGALDEYWLGLEKIYWLTNQRSYRLRVTMQIGNGEFRYAEYDNFYIDSEADNFKLHVGGYSGTAGDGFGFVGFGGMRQHNGQPFSTPDRDNDSWGANNCAEEYHSGWWFNDCYWANLNGVYIEQTNGWPFCDNGLCIAWRSIDGYEDYSLLKTEMEILPNRRSTHNG